MHLACLHSEASMHVPRLRIYSIGVSVVATAFCVIQILREFDCQRPVLITLIFLFCRSSAAARAITKLHYAHRFCKQLYSFCNCYNQFFSAAKGLPKYNSHHMCTLCCAHPKISGGSICYWRLLALSLQKIGCTLAKHSSKLDALRSVCTIFAQSNRNFNHKFQ